MSIPTTPPAQPPHGPGAPQRPEPGPGVGSPDLEASAGGTALRDQIAEAIWTSQASASAPAWELVLTYSEFAGYLADARQRADAVMTVVMSAHRPDLDEIPGDPAALAEMWAFICGRARWLESLKSRAQQRAERAEAEREQLRSTALGLVTSVQNERDELLAERDRLNAAYWKQTKTLSAERDRWASEAGQAEAALREVLAAFAVITGPDSGAIIGYHAPPIHPSDFARWSSTIGQPGPEPEKCRRCHGLGKVPDWSSWDDYHGEPRPKPCPDCTPAQKAPDPPQEKP